MVSRYTYHIYFAFSCLLAAFIVFGMQSCKKEEVPEVTGYVQYGTPFANTPATENIIMYEVNLRAFSNTGDIQGVIAGLDHLEALSINTIWLMPVYTEGIENSVNSPYCIKDYTSVSDEYGTLDDLRALTEAAHARNMTVILDWVANHTSWDNAWMDHPEWYAQDAFGNIIHPPGTTWTDVAELNYNNEEMRAAMIDAMRYWILEANVDGYRCDYADGVPFDFWQQAIDSLRNIPDRSLIMLAEGDRDDHYTAGFDMTYSWDYYSTMQNVFNGSPVYDLYSTNNNEYAGIPLGKKKLRFTTNHDESAWNATPMTLFGGIAGATAASVMTIFLQGVPLIYTGQETGRSSTLPFFTASPINWALNPDMQTAYNNILSVYASHATARNGALSTYSNADVFCIRKTGDEEFAVLVNARNEEKMYALPTVLKNTDWTDAITNTDVSLTTEVTLAPYEYILLVR